MKLAALVFLAAAVASASSYHSSGYQRFIGGKYSLPEMKYYYPEQYHYYKGLFPYYNKDIYNYYRMPYFYNDFYTVQVPEEILKTYLPESIFRAYVPTTHSLIQNPFVPEHILKNYFPDDLFKFYVPQSPVEYYPVPIPTLHSYLPENIFRTFVPYMASKIQEDYYVPQSLLKTFLPESMFRTVMTHPYGSVESGIYKSLVPVESQEVMGVDSFLRSGSVGFKPEQGFGYEYGYGYPVVQYTQPIVDIPAVY